jgi:cell division protein FtsL
MWELRLFFAAIVGLFVAILLMWARKDLEHQQYLFCPHGEKYCITYSIQEIKYDKKTENIIDNKYIATGDKINDFFMQKHKVEDFYLQIYIVMFLSAIIGALVTVDYWGRKIYADENLSEQINILKERLDKSQKEKEQSQIKISEIQHEASKLSKDKEKLLSEYQNLESKYNNLELDLLKKYKQKEDELYSRQAGLDAHAQYLSEKSKRITKMQEEAEQKTERYKEQMKNIMRKAEQNKQVAANLKRELKFINKLLQQNNLGFAKRKLKKLLKENKIA